MKYTKNKLTKQNLFFETLDIDVIAVELINNKLIPLLKVKSLI